MSEWQPIETAPKEEMVMFYSNRGICIGCYDLYYAEGGRGYTGRSGWVEEYSGEEITPTHWMPLPPSPAMQPETKPGGERHERIPRSELPRLPDDAPMLVLRDAWGKTITDETPVNEETCPHTWTLEVEGGMWVLGVEVFKLMPEAQVRQANLLRDLVRVWNKIVALNAVYPEGQG